MPATSADLVLRPLRYDDEAAFRRAHEVMAAGHIGYGVLPEHRRRGYAGEVLRQSLASPPAWASSGRWSPATTTTSARPRSSSAAVVCSTPTSWAGAAC